MEVTPHVHSLYVKLDWFPQPYPPNVHLVVDGEEGALVDAGFPDEQSVKSRLEALREFSGLKLRYIVITHHHFDHTSGANKLREATGARIVMHEAEAPLLARAASEDLPSDMDAPPERQEFSEGARLWRQEAAKGAPDETVSDGGTLRVGGLTLRAVHTPGHTAGHISPYLEEEKLLFAGDNVLGYGTTVVPPPPHGDMAQYVESLRKMQSLEAELMCCGHGPVVTEPNRKLQELIDHRHEREEQILSLVKKGRDTVKRIVSSVYPELDKRLLGMAASQITSHLAKLEREERVRTEGEGEARRVELCSGGAPAEYPRPLTGEGRPWPGPGRGRGEGLEREGRVRTRADDMRRLPQDIPGKAIPRRRRILRVRGVPSPLAGRAHAPRQAAAYRPADSRRACLRGEGSDSRPPCRPEPA